MMLSLVTISRELVIGGEIVDFAFVMIGWPRTTVMDLYVVLRDRDVVS